MVAWFKADVSAKICHSMNGEDLIWLQLGEVADENQEIVLIS
jgi:hypothetical protein